MTSQPGDPSFPVDRLRGALLCTPEHRQLYLENARFHHDIDMLARWLPMWIGVMATETRRAAEVDKLVAARLAEAAPLRTFEVSDGPGQLHTPDGQPKSLAELMADVETSMADAKAEADRVSRHPSPPRQEWMEPHDYAAPDGDGAPCCHLPPEDAIHTMPTDPGDWHDHNVGVVPDDEPI
jgi:hypothetical protein